MSKVIIIGGGAAGMIAAISAAGIGHEVSLYEKNEKLGKKLFITGKGRCNVTNASDMKTVMDNVVSNPKFLYSAFKTFTNQDIMKMIEDAGCMLKVERGNRVFPVSNHSYDVIRSLESKLKELNVKVNLFSEVKTIVVEDGKCKGIVLKKDDKKIMADSVIVATGGMSYSSTGSTGDGYKFAKGCGHTVTQLYPSLVPFVVEEEECKSLQGLSLKNVEVSIFDGSQIVHKEFGEMLFTHYGVSGPILLSASSIAVPLLKERMLTLSIDLKPALSVEQLDARILRDFEAEKNKQYKNSLSGLFPSKLIAEVVRQSGIDPDKKVNEITKEERNSLVECTKGLRFTISGVRGYNEAIITKGGVSVKEINPATMESKVISNLYFVGEVLDLDALTGGYNLQIAWSTGWCAGSSIEYV